MKNLKHPAVFIFGAGATRGAFSTDPIPPPTDKDFFDIANQIKERRTQQLARDILAEVWKLYNRTSGISLEAAYRDIETRVTIGEIVKPPNQPKRWEIVKDNFIELIRRVYVQTTTKTIKEHLVKKDSSIHKSILNLVKTGDTLITFNYDLLIEESFQTGDLWNPITGYGIDFGGRYGSNWYKNWAEDKKYKGKKHKVLLLKLHGSINWKKKGTFLHKNPYTAQGGVSKKPRKFPVSILAPGWKKDIESEPYVNFWKLAGKKLRDCKTLVILGYSLPETDIIARSLFSEVVRSREVRSPKIKLEQLHIADPLPHVRERFIDLFSPVLDSSGAVYQYSSIEEFRDERIPTESRDVLLKKRIETLENRVSTLEFKKPKNIKNKKEKKL